MALCSRYSIAKWRTESVLPLALVMGLVATPDPRDDRRIAW